jgi:hypothetical protein
LRVQQQCETAVAFFQIFHVVRDDGVQVAQAVWAAQFDDRVPVRIENRERLARGAVFVFESREKFGQSAVVVFGEGGFCGAFELDEWRFHFDIHLTRPPRTKFAGRPVA